MNWMRTGMLLLGVSVSLALLLDAQAQEEKKRPFGGGFGAKGPLVDKELADKLKLFIQQQVHFNGKIINSFVENYKTTVQFTPNEALNIYRICQEAISNAIKHSGCTELIIKLESYSASGFLIEITDNGKGFDTEKEHPQHYGLINMQHRSEEAGVQLKIESVNSGGTKVILTK